MPANTVALESEIARLGDEVDALKREVEWLREQVRRIGALVEEARDV